MTDINDDQKIMFNRRTFFKLPLAAVAGATLTAFGIPLIEPQPALAAPWSGAGVRFLPISQMPGLPAEWVASTISRPTKPVQGSGAYEQNGNQYYVYPGNTASFRMINCGTDADGKKFDVVVRIGPVKALSPDNGRESMFPNQNRKCIAFCFGGLEPEDGIFGWDIGTFCAEGYTKIRYYLTGTDIPANVKIFGTFSDIDVAAGTMYGLGVNGVKGGDEGVCFPNQTVDVYYKPGCWMDLDQNLGGAFSVKDGGTNGNFDDRTQISVLKAANWIDVYYTGASCSVLFSFKLPGGVVKYFSDGSGCYVETWSAGTWHTVPAAANTAGNKTNCSGPFEGWYTDAACTQKYNGSTLREGTINLYSCNFAVVHYRVDESETDIFTETIRVNNQHIASAEATKKAIKAGCSLNANGWCTDAACMNKYNGSTIVNDIYLYANNIATVHYRVDGSTEDTYAESIEPGSKYISNPRAATLGTKENCAGFEGWYTDSGYKNKYIDGTVIEVDTVLYGRNKVTLDYGTTDRSFILSPEHKFYVDEDLSVLASNEVLYPPQKTYYYNANVRPINNVKVWYEDAFKERKLVSSGVYAKPDATLPVNGAVVLQRNTTLYIDWTPDRFDGVSLW